MCTTFTLNKDETLLLGQNYDFYYGHGLIVVSPRGLKKESLTEEGERKVAWITKYGTVTFSQFGRELPMSGMNETGLTIAMMFHEDGVFPQKDERPALNELQWIQYQLDNYRSVDEVIKHLHEIRLEKSIYELHYTVMDASGKTALIEFIEGVAQVTDNSDFYTITNTSFNKSASYAQQFRKKSIDRLSRKATSLDRFTLAYRLVEEVHQKGGNASRTETNPPPSQMYHVTEAFRILEEVSVKPSFQSIWNWIGKKIPPTFTYWSIVFDVKNGEIYYKDQKNKNIRMFSLRDFQFSGDAPVMALALDNQLTGNIGKAFAPYRLEDNERIISISYKPISDMISKEEQQELAKYPDTFKRVQLK
ncbi:linear amide C-N hydrolase [Evansella tamaricis]|uniref:Linear amide C-N hydrolase n=1 Tax=Evansella tamaricis TaxID=2069301 RepID=A0ABS6JAH8_9BACI|nr:linear amide C-N hydrolase [Evansella tamaricis]MBU9710184.1 linear amide C-N hydrolase [Evansella tamaricis]